MAVSIDRPCSTSPRCHTCTRKDEARYAVRGIALRSARERCVPPRVPCVPTCRRPSAWRARLGHAAGALPLQRAHGVLPGGSRGVVPTGSPPKGGPRACCQRAACWRPHRRARRPATARSTRAPLTSSRLSFATSPTDRVSFDWARSPAAGSKFGQKCVTLFRQKTYGVLGPASLLGFSQ